MSYDYDSNTCIGDEQACTSWRVASSAELCYLGCAIASCSRGDTWDDSIMIACTINPEPNDALGANQTPYLSDGDSVCTQCPTGLCLTDFAIQNALWFVFVFVFMCFVCRVWACVLECFAFLCSYSESVCNDEVEASSSSESNSESDSSSKSEEPSSKKSKDSSSKKSKDSSSGD